MRLDLIVFTFHPTLDHSPCLYAAVATCSFSAILLVEKIKFSAAMRAFIPKVDRNISLIAHFLAFLIHIFFMFIKNRVFDTQAVLSLTGK